MKQVNVTFTRASFADATIEIPDDMELSYITGPDNPSPFAKTVWDWYDQHKDKLQWSHDGIEEDVAGFEKL